MYHTYILYYARLAYQSKIAKNYIYRNNLLVIYLAISFLILIAV